jgi:hypothetical protein
MRISIDFDNQYCLRAIKVGDKPVDRVLPPDPRSQLMVANMIPDFRLGGREGWRISRERLRIGG